MGLGFMGLGFRGLGFMGLGFWVESSSPIRALIIRMGF